MTEKKPVGRPPKMAGDRVRSVDRPERIGTVVDFELQAQATMGRRPVKDLPVTPVTYVVQWDDSPDPDSGIAEDSLEQA